jgi:nitrous oxidase accessory protein NosD
MKAMRGSEPFHIAALRKVTSRVVSRLCRPELLAMCAITIAGAAAHAAQEIVVPRDFSTIQAAVDAAAPGDTIRIRPGTYTEQVVVAKNLTIKGAGTGATVIQAPAVLDPYAFAPAPQLPIVALVLVTDGANVNISGVTVTGPIHCGVAAVGVAVAKSATLELTRSRVTRIRFEEPCSGPLVADAIDVGLSATVEIDGQRGTTGHAVITDVVVDRYHRLGMAVLAPPGEAPSTATFSGNRISGGELPDGLMTQQWGIVISGPGPVFAQVEKNTIDGNVCTFPGCGPDPITEAPSIGIWAIAATSAHIAGNRVSNNDIGIAQSFSPSCCAIEENKLEDNRFFGIAIKNGNGSTTNNKIKGGQVGIGVVADLMDTVGLLQGDKIKHTSDAPVKEFECCGFTATAIVQEH